LQHFSLNQKHQAIAGLNGNSLLWSMKKTTYSLVEILKSEQFQQSCRSHGWKAPLQRVEVSVSDSVQREISQIHHFGSMCRKESFCSSVSLLFVSWAVAVVKSKYNLLESSREKMFTCLLWGTMNTKNHRAHMDLWSMLHSWTHGTSISLYMLQRCKAIQQLCRCGAAFRPRGAHVTWRLHFKQGKSDSDRVHPHHVSLNGARPQVWTSLFDPTVFSSEHFKPDSAAEMWYFTSCGFLPSRHIIVTYFAVDEGATREKSVTFSTPLKDALMFKTISQSEITVYFLHQCHKEMLLVLISDIIVRKETKRGRNKWFKSNWEQTEWNVSGL